MHNTPRTLLQLKSTAPIFWLTSKIRYRLRDFTGWALPVPGTCGSGRPGWKVGAKVVGVAVVGEPVGKVGETVGVFVNNIAPLHLAWHGFLYSSLVICPLTCTNAVTTFKMTSQPHGGGSGVVHPRNASQVQPLILSQ